jgi:DNA-binding NarL/FixJ family response regulator
MNPQEDSLAISSIRVLVVEDYEPFRRFVISTLQQQPELQVICEASDGLEGIRRARELQPDLVLLDIGLPTLNGIEVARQIRKLCPRSTILFVSQENSSEIVQGALSTAAKGYVFKADAGRELLVAVNAVLRGQQFVSSSLASDDFSDPKDEYTGGPERKKVAPLPPGNVAIRHEVAFFPEHAALVDGFARVAEAALKVGNSAIIIATEPHRSGILHRLTANAVDVEAVLKQGTLIQLDVLDSLRAVMANDLPDPLRCAEMVGDVITRASKAAKGEHARVAICGECSPTLLSEGNVEAAIRLEQLWNNVTRNYNADTLCGYLWSGFPREESVTIFRTICAQHSAVIGRELGY